jgi:crotonobetainyl-CoA:carnitine CoA-transferase CaiB-like acyl-CoA transferase
MTGAVERTGGARPLAVSRAEALESADKRDLVLFAAGTLAAWAHTIDEIRIGELIAVPFGIANAAVVAAWPRLRAGWRAS